MEGENKVGWSQKVGRKDEVREEDRQCKVEREINYRLLIDIL